MLVLRFVRRGRSGGNQVLCHFYLEWPIIEGGDGLINVLESISRKERENIRKPLSEVGLEAVETAQLFRRLPPIVQGL